MGIVPEHDFDDFTRNGQISPLCQSSTPYLYGVGKDNYVYRTTIPYGKWEQRSWKGTSAEKIIVHDNIMYVLLINGHIRWSSAITAVTWERLVDDKKFIDLAYSRGYMYALEHTGLIFRAKVLTKGCKEGQSICTSGEWENFTHGVVRRIIIDDYDDKMFGIFSGKILRLEMKNAQGGWKEVTRDLDRMKDIAYHRGLGLA